VKTRILVAFGLFFALLTAFAATKSNTAARPNIIFVLCDDLGAGDLGVLWQISPWTPAPNGTFVWPRHGHFCPSPCTFHGPNRMAPIDEALNQFLETVKALSVVAMAKPFCGRSTNQSKCHRCERVLI
jgi:hypothetical protein